MENDIGDIVEEQFADGEELLEKIEQIGYEVVDMEDDYVMIRKDNRIVKVNTRLYVDSIEAE